MTGQRGPSGLLVKKPTALVSNEVTFLEAVKKFKCDGNHQHESVTGEALSAAKLWTWTLAKTLANVVVRLTNPARSRKSSGEP